MELTKEKKDKLGSLDCVKICEGIEMYPTYSGELKLYQDGYKQYFGPEEARDLARRLDAWADSVDEIIKPANPDGGDNALTGEG